MNLKLNAAAIAKLNGAIDKAFKETVEAYGDECQEAIESPIWKWDGYTLRKNGEFVGSPRDIVDTGELRDSQQEPVYDGNSATIEWTAEHAGNVHEGIDSNGNPIPARPWTEEAMRNTDFEGIMGEALKRELS
ncbi:MAG: hypothetical protein KME13_25295 [Myxacorys californica WJT36-NPBG1]|nr:hypothetical protein [Myxacorys californica WJT36-NPBG1]